MEKIKNTQEITEIIMKPVAFTKCKIGQDWYKNRFKINFVPYAFYPDYMEVNEFVMKEIDGKEFNIEDAVDEIYTYLLRYEPTYLQVTDYIENCKTHFDVEVTKSSGLLAV